MARRISQHTEWLYLIEVSGPFLVVSELENIFPQGLDVVETPRRQRVRAAYEEWCDAVDENDPQLDELHNEWINLVVSELLEYDDSVLIPNHKLDEPLSYNSPEHAGSFSPDFVIKGDSDSKSKLMISIQPPGTDLEKVKVGDGWPASLLERMTMLCRQEDIRLGLLTNGERWMLVNAPVGSTSGNASWYARLWFQEPVTLKAFQSLLGVRRCFGPSEESLEALLEESLKHQEEVTDTLGEQVKRAVEVLVQCLDKADQDRNRQLLHDVPPAELYEAGLTVMMRLVFILCAEERGLLLLDEPIYEQYYAVSSLRAQLDEEADHHGPEVLERRHDSWARLLAVFRAVYGGIEHETLRMPALGGSLFDPDRFPFLEGRPKGTDWHEGSAKPLPIDNRTVLLLLNALQILEQKGGALLLSYKALNVEQIGHVYEGLLEHTVARVPEITLGLEGSQKAKNPNVSLAELESARLDGEKTLVDLLKEATKRSASAIKNALKKEIDDTIFAKVVAVCGGDTELARRIRPFANLLRADAWGDFIVYKAESFAVTLGADRRETGTHYTPKSLTESIVSTTLEPVAYIGPAEGKQREDWNLKSPAELLDLKVCDPAMGSGAFLVQACRWLSERVVEAWGKEETQGKFVTIDGEALDYLGSAEPMPKSLDDRLVIARRLIAEKCLYGIDLNHLAVELSKLSIWLTTLAKGRPFGFLDHNLRCGDSLLGIHRLDQLIKLTMNPDDPKIQPRLFGKNIEQAILEVMELRKKLRRIPIRDIHDVEAMAKLDEQARKKLQSIELVADAFVGEAFKLGEDSKAMQVSFDRLSIEAGELFKGNLHVEKTIKRQREESLSIELSDSKPARKPLHWPLEFPEVFERGGFDAVIGNPPYLGGRKIRGALGGKYLEYLTCCLYPGSSANADLCAFFVRRVNMFTRESGTNGFIATSSMSEGDTREVGLQAVLASGNSIIKASSKSVWPGTASVTFSPIWIYHGTWNGDFLLDGKVVSKINSFLAESDLIDSAPEKLKYNYQLSYQGSIPLGEGFVLTKEEIDDLIAKDKKNSKVICPYLVGKELNIHPQHEASQWIINFRNWPLDRNSAPDDYDGPVATDYPDCLEIIKQRVYPERKKKKRDQKWWQYWRLRSELYSKLEQLNWALAIATQATKYVAFGQVFGKKVYSNAIAIIASDDFALAAVLSSSIHEIWARRYGGYNLLLLRYSPSDLFDTFALPPLGDGLRKLGQQYYELRGNAMLNRNEGLTKIYNRFHDSEEASDDIQKLRDLHVEMDEAISDAYDWDGLKLCHGFHETKQGLRFTISEEARREVLQRLLKLNHERYAEEVAQGLHDKNKKNKTKKKIDSKQEDLF